MTKEEAWKIIESCKNWNTGQRSISFCMNGVRTQEDDILDARREALAEAWRTVAAKEKPQHRSLDLTTSIEPPADPLMEAAERGQSLRWPNDAERKEKP